MTGSGPRASGWPDTGANGRPEVPVCAVPRRAAASDDTTIVNLALPSVEQAAHASSDALEWVVSGYALTFGLALVPVGRIGDRFGYKRLFLTGLSLFTLASVACGVAAHPGELIAARLVQGLGAGIYYPAISAITSRASPACSARCQSSGSKDSAGARSTPACSSCRSPAAAC
jgi:hypothetical protein